MISPSLILFQVFGGFLLFGIILVASVMPLCVRTKCCGKSKCCNRKLQYDKLILEEEENVLKEILRKSAKKQLSEKVKNKICGEQWEECFDVAEELIKASTKPAISEEEKPPQQGARATEPGKDSKSKLFPFSLPQGVKQRCK